MAPQNRATKNQPENKPGPTQEREIGGTMDTTTAAYEEVRFLAKSGMSHGQIAERTGLSLKEVSTAIDALPAGP